MFERFYRRSLVFQQELCVSKSLSFRRVCLLFCAVLFVVGSASQEAHAALDIGRQIPSFKRKTLAGGSLSSRTLQGHKRSVVLLFKTAHCADCREALEHLSSVQKQSKTDDIHVLAVGSGSLGEIASFTRGLKLSYPLLLGDSGLFRKLGASFVMPVAIVVDSSGRVVSYLEGYGGNNRKRLMAMMAFTGKVESKDGVKFAARFDDAQRKVSSSSQEVSSPPRGLMTTRDLNFLKVHALHRSGEQSFGSITENSVVHSGDQYKIVFTSKSDLYLYIFQVDSVGRVYQLFPIMRFSNPLSKGLTYALPSDSQAFQFDDKVGKEHVYFITAGRADKELEKLSYALKQAQDRNYSVKKISKIESKLKNIFQKQETAVVSHVTEKVLWDSVGRAAPSDGLRIERGRCGQCMHTLTFIHR